MTDERTFRRLAAIFAADVAGYSRLTEQDEVGTRTRLNAILADVITPALDEYRGRLFKTMGDGYLAEFASVIDAVECAIAIQDQMEIAGAGDDDPIRLRIGVNLGDVIVEGEDLHGDGVNVAARIEALAEPGSVYVSRSAHDQIRDKLAYGIEDLGEQDVKNISRPVRVFRVTPGPADSEPQALPGKTGNSKWSVRRLSAIAVFLGALVLSGFVM